MQSVLFVVAHDSQFKWAASAAKPFRDNGWAVGFFSPTEHARISEAQMADAGVSPDEVTSSDGRSNAWFWAEHDVVFFLTPGGITERYIYALRERIQANPQKRPIIVSAYVGMVIDGHVGGYLYRAASDLICVNSPYDYEVYAEAAKDFGISTSSLEVTGLSIIGAETEPQKEGDIRQVLFADQLAIPDSTIDRKVVYQNLLEYAVKHPSRRVIVKPRHRPDEGSFHKGKYPPETHFAGRPLPRNLSIDYTPISELLPTTDLLLTVSSTAALEALAQGVRVGIIADVGVREKHGNHMFIGSGLIRTFDQIASDDIGSPSADWLAKYQHHGVEPVQAIYNAVLKKLDERPALIEAPILVARQRFTNDPWGFRPAPKKRGPGPKTKSFIKDLLPPIAVRPSKMIARRLGII
ncbi:DUF6716 putative glycosyltransferase [Nitratireductor aquimarinus]|uniref:DUF6716 putative glycosyltransferase n=1 Tax=Nitratireductor aquimarinus TaxID=889300 RepID=UPI0029365930|nr:DUF6716 putative glycosyltransferase [Nitratireductor aquimarinus]MDV2964540.1 DUF6716 putative glycosyltransferase [Nitratireductor aquimarinus]